MAALSFHERLILDERLPTLLRDALGLAAGSVYVGRRARKCQQPVEVRIQDATGTDLTRGATHRRFQHVHELHVALRVGTDASGVGELQTRQLNRAMTLAKNALHGLRPFAADMADLLSHSVEVVAVDLNPSKLGTIEGVLLLRSFTDGDGLELVGAGQGEAGGDQ